MNTTTTDRSAHYIVEAMIWDTDYSFAAACDDYARSEGIHIRQADACLRGYIANAYPNRGRQLINQ